jgi:hypothetical protein
VKHAVSWYLPADTDVCLKNHHSQRRNQALGGQGNLDHKVTSGSLTLAIGGTILVVNVPLTASTHGVVGDKTLANRRDSPLSCPRVRCDRYSRERGYLRARLRAESYPEGALFKGYTGKGYHDSGVVDGDFERQHRRMYSGNDRKTCSTSAGSGGNQDHRDRFDRRRAKMVLPAQAAAIDNLERYMTGDYPA